MPSLPEYDKPPVSEVVMGVALAPMARWGAPFGGVLWSEVRDAYPNCEAYPPVTMRIEKFGDEKWIVPALSLEAADADLMRFWYLTADGTRLIQVQKDAFLVNWRRVRGDEVYPRYEIEMRPRFISEYQRFANFVVRHNLGELDVLQGEITYVNDIYQGASWHNFSEVCELFTPWWKGGESPSLSSPSSLSISAIFEEPERRRKLFIEGRHVRRAADGREAFQLKLTVKGVPESPALEHLLQWFDDGRAWIVRSFDDLSSEKAHKLWEKKE